MNKVKGFNMKSAYSSPLKQKGEESISKSFGATQRAEKKEFKSNQRAERKEYRSEKKDAFEKARDRGELKFDAVAPLDSSFTSLTAATASNIFNKAKVKKSVRDGFDKGYKKQEPTSSSSQSKVNYSNAESDYNKEKDAIELRAKTSRNSHTPETESEYKDRSSYTPKNEVNIPKKATPASPTSTTKSPANPTQSNSNTNSGEQNIKNRVKQLKNSGEIKENKTSSVSGRAKGPSYFKESSTSGKMKTRNMTSSEKGGVDFSLFSGVNSSLFDSTKSKATTKKNTSSGNVFVDFFNK